MITKNILKIYHFLVIADWCENQRYYLLIMLLFSAPSPPTFVITHVTETGFTIIYEPSHVGLPGTVFFVQYRQPGIVHWLESVRTFINRTITVDGLMSGK